ncbi:MAG: DUF3817 domain-containing protein, partial [Bacteroidota bacterium]
MRRYFNSNIGRLRLIAFLEGLSFLVLLFIAMPMKYWGDNPEPVRIVGGLHGLLFVLFGILLLMTWTEKKWPFKTAFLIFLSSLVPFGTFYIDHK